MVTSAITIVFANLQLKHEVDIQSLRYMLKRVLPRNRNISTPIIDLNTDLLTIFSSAIMTTLTFKPLIER